MPPKEKLHKSDPNGHITCSRGNRATKEAAKSVVAFTKAALDCLRTFPTSTRPIIGFASSARHTAQLPRRGFGGNVWRFGKYPLL